MWKKGQSGNPNGKPKGALNLTSILKQHLSEDQRAEKLMQAVVKRAHDKSDPLVKEILERVDGKVPQAIDATIDTTVNIVFDESFNEE